METSQQQATNPTETNTGVYTSPFRRPNPQQWVSREKKVWNLFTLRNGKNGRQAQQWPSPNHF